MRCLYRCVWDCGSVMCARLGNFGEYMVCEQLALLCSRLIGDMGCCGAGISKTGYSTTRWCAVGHRCMVNRCMMGHGHTVRSWRPTYRLCPAHAHQELRRLSLYLQLGRSRRPHFTGSDIWYDTRVCCSESRDRRIAVWAAYGSIIGGATYAAPKERL